MNLEAPKQAPSVLERAQRYLERCPPAISGQQGHNTTFRIACALMHGFALTEAEALSVLQPWNARCQPPWSEAELRHKVTSAAHAPPKRPRGYLTGGRAERRPTGGGPVTVMPAPPPARSKPEFQPATLKRVAALMPEVDAQYVKDRSPLAPETQTPASFLHRIYKPGESVAIFDRKYSQGLVYTMEEGPFDAGCLDHFIHGCPDGVYYMSLPVDGEFHPNPRQGGKKSRRSQESVTDWRHLVLESDDAEERDWLALLVQLPLRITAIYSSGGNSIHVLVRVDATSKAHWDAMAKKMERMLTVLGADWKTVTAVRLTRLPGCWRGEKGPPRPRSMPARDGWRTEPLEFDERGDPIWIPKPQPELPPASLWRGGKLQELLYLDPEPDGKPIRFRPTRQEIREAWQAQKRAEMEEQKSCL